VSGDRRAHDLTIEIRSTRSTTPRRNIDAARTAAPASGARHQVEAVPLSRLGSREASSDLEPRHALADMPSSHSM